MTQEFMIQQATQMFLAHGYKTTTMDELAMELGISKKTLYENFRNKESLIKLSLEFQFHELSEIFEESKRLNLDAISEMQHIMDRIKNQFFSVQRFHAINQLQKYYAKIYNKVYIEQAILIQESIFQNIVKGQKDDLYRENVNPNDFAEILLKTQAYLRMHDQITLDLNRTETLTLLHLDIMMRGILTNKGMKIYSKFENENNEI